MKISLATALLLVACIGFGQGAFDTLRVDKPDIYTYVEPTDSMSQMLTDSILTYDEFMFWVEANHPVAQIADLEVELSRRNLTQSRGGFDPMLSGNYRRKDFKNTEYYDALRAGLEIPTWAGLSFQAAYEDNQGVFLNPEETVPQSGLISAGLTAQLGAGLLMDSRRAALRQAQIGVEQGQNERQIIRNILYFEATQAFFQWSLANQVLGVAENAVELATIRYEGVRQSFFLGDVPAIDTVEAYTQVLNRLFDFREAQNQWVEAVNFASIYIWDGEGNPVMLPPGIRPLWAENVEFSQDIIPTSIELTHPQILKLLFKREIIRIDRRLAAEYLRPKVELKYNFLTENVLPAPADEFFQNSQFFENNYTLGAKVSFPLFLREARGKLGMNTIKLEMVERDLEVKRAELEAKLNSTLVKLSNLRDQIDFFTQNVDLLQRLLEGERIRFEIGESSLFLINARETKLIESRIKLFELIAKEKILVAELRNIAGFGFTSE